MSMVIGAIHIRLHYFQCLKLTEALYVVKVIIGESIRHADHGVTLREKLLDNAK